VDNPRYPRLSAVRCDVENAFSFWDDHPTNPGGSREEAWRRVGLFFCQVEGERDLLRDALAALFRIETLVNEDAPNERAISHLFERIHDTAGAVLLKARTASHPLPGFSGGTEG
jgi:hypothetical protein